jgi:hypothetical protein
MALKSALFRGDTQLENAATSDPAHILTGARGSHVEKLHVALMFLDHATIADDELAADLYGRSTATAVLAYKTKRKIINPAYQTAPDNIVGKLTIAALDQEIAASEARRVQSGCDYTPAKTRLLRKRFFFAIATPASLQPVGLATSGPRPTLDLALDNVPVATTMRNKAREALNDLISQSNTPARALGLAALVLHYKATAAAEIDRVAHEVRNGLAGVLSRLLSARAWLRQGQGSGFAETPTPRDGHSYIQQGYASAGPLMRPTILIHEAFHDLDGFNQDFGGNPARDNGAAYHTNSTDIQLKNAYAMSQFVLHINLGHEKFLNDNE